MFLEKFRDSYSGNHTAKMFTTRWKLSFKLVSITLGKLLDIVTLLYIYTTALLKGSVSNNSNQMLLPVWFTSVFPESRIYIIYRGC